MSEATSVPRPARVEDWDSDESSAVPKTCVEARSNASSSRTRQPKPMPTSQPQKTSASDSGYSSHTSAAMPTKDQRPQAATATQAPKGKAAELKRSTSKHKPVIHRIDTAPEPTRTAQCLDPSCRHAQCANGRNGERHFSIPPPQPRSQSSATARAQPFSPQYSYPVSSMPPPASTQPVSMQVPQARPRLPRSYSGTRPVSFHGYSANAQSFDASQRGPPPSASAYYANVAYAPVAWPQQNPSYYGSTPPGPSYTYYSPTSPEITSPTSPTFSRLPGYSGNYSARQANPTVPGLEVPKPLTQTGLTRTLSARRSDGAALGIPDSFPRPESPESSSESASERDFADDSYAVRRRSHPVRESRYVTSSSRRPSVDRTYSSSTAPPKSYGEPRPQLDLDYPSSSDYVDSDRTARAVLDRRGVSSSRSSRRPSVSTTASSGRTKATTTSSMSDYSKVIIEDEYGRRASYLSKEKQGDLMRAIQRQKIDEMDEKERQQRRKVENIAAYQRQVEGESYELTAENIRKQQQQRNSPSLSGRSHKSSRSSSKAAKTDGIKIQSGDTILHVYGDAQIEMRPGDDGGPAQFVIASSTGRDSGYQTSSKSSSSRTGLLRAPSTKRSSRRPSIQEERTA